MIVLDTNVVSELMRSAAEPRVARWVDSFPATDVVLTAVTSAELLYGIARLPEGRRRRELHDAIKGLLEEDFAGQVLPFDAAASAHYAQIATGRERSGRPISMPDAQIAAICRSWGARLATRNVADFVGTGVEAIDPWTTTLS